MTGIQMLLFPSLMRRMHVRKELDMAAQPERVWAWLLQASLRLSANSCDVLTEETLHGWLARLGQLFLPKRMSKYQQIWLESLQAKALSGFPGGD
ncbi:hypothetical protein [Methylomonas fluvii]|uniref:Uncharacterized protein n=1 Tax=Methylomonas fluvii TaxID=1854564 RepID=A0ABR9D9D9_9GAMM|nr:hypothetical protein [Methylomonas fluvii]MBD9359731.1 hypothetical protein [Methylomonas fluvii]